MFPAMPGWHGAQGGVGGAGDFQVNRANSRPAGIAVEGRHVYVLDESEIIYVYSRGGVLQFQVRVPRSLTLDSLWPANGAMGGIFTTGEAYPWLGVVATRKRSDNHVQYGLTWFQINRDTGNLTYLKTEALAEIADTHEDGAPDTAVGCTAGTDLAGNPNRGNLYVLGANGRVWRYLLDENTDDVASSPQVRAASKAPNQATLFPRVASIGYVPSALFHVDVPVGTFGPAASHDAYNLTDAFCVASAYNAGSPYTIHVLAKPYSYGPLISSRNGLWQAASQADLRLTRGAAADTDNDVWFVLSDGRVMVRPFVLPVLH